MDNSAISRKNFIKTVGLGAAAIGLGKAQPPASEEKVFVRTPLSLNELDRGVTLGKGADVDLLLCGVSYVYDAETISVRSSHHGVGRMLLSKKLPMGTRLINFSVRSTCSGEIVCEASIQKTGRDLAP